MHTPAMPNERFAAALSRHRSELCPAECDCAYARRIGIGHTQRYGLDDSARRRPAWDCTRMTVSNYLAKVYPTAASRYEMGESATGSALFDGLHFYYDHGCDQLAKCGPPGVMLRSLSLIHI